MSTTSIPINRPPFFLGGAWHCYVGGTLHGPWDNRGAALAGYTTELQRLLGRTPRGWASDPACGAEFHDPPGPKPKVDVTKAYLRERFEEFLQRARMNDLSDLEIFLAGADAAYDRMDEYMKERPCGAATKS